MKTLLFTVACVVITTIVSAQVCDSFLVETKDKFTGEVTISTDDVKIVNGEKQITWKLSISNVFYKDAIILTIRADRPSGLGCVDDNAITILLLEDDTRIQSPNAYTFNCDGLVGLMFFTRGITSKSYIKQLERLRTIRVKAIRIPLNKEYYDIDIPPDNADEIKQAVECALSRLGK